MKQQKNEQQESFKECAIAEIQPIVHGKWAMVVIFFLSKGTVRFGELSRQLPMITQANLTKELRMLEKHGLVHREVYREVPPKVEYSLTDTGRRFLPVIEELEKFAVGYHNAYSSEKEE